MSHHQYVARVHYDDGRGCIKAPGLYRSITQAPKILGLPKLEMIDYVPELGVAQLRVCMGERREMFPAEVTTLAAWLLGLQAAAAAAPPETPPFPFPAPHTQ